MCLNKKKGSETDKKVCWFKPKNFINSLISKSVFLSKNGITIQQFEASHRTADIVLCNHFAIANYQSKTKNFSGL